jgi:cytidyltransferase-like protein
MPRLRKACRVGYRSGAAAAAGRGGRTDGAGRHAVSEHAYGRIVRLEDWASLREDLGTIVCTSGGFDPLHPGHATCIVESRRLGDSLVVVVNGDAFLRAKKGRPFQDLATRCQIVACLRGVDFVIPFEIEGDPTVREALRAIRPHVFTKGGDRVDGHTIPEWEVCEAHGIRIETGVGLKKDWSSSDFLREWGEFWAARRTGEER